MKANGHCPKCGSQKIISDVQVRESGSNTGTQVVVHENREALIFKGTHVRSLQAWICGSCGYTELYVYSPEELYEADSKNRKPATLSEKELLLRPASVSEETPAEELLRPAPPEA